MISAARDFLRRFELLRRVRDDVDLLYKYKRWRPERVTMIGSEHRLYANPREPRGRALLRSRCNGQPELKRLWLRALTVLLPEQVLDIGANYGEFLFLPRYPADCRVLGIEADPALRSYLERSRAEHPCAHQIELLCAAAGAYRGEVTFHIDADWSGRSSIEARASHGKTRPIQVPQVTLDEACRERPSRLLFKIDVEGHEPEVLSGMKELLTHSSQAIGLLEFDARALADLGKTPDGLLERLRDSFAIWGLQRGAPPTRIDRPGDLPDPDRHADLVVASDARLGSELGLPA